MSTKRMTRRWAEAANNLLEAIRLCAADRGKILSIHVDVDLVTVNCKRGRKEFPITELTPYRREHDAFVSKLRSTFDVPVVDRIEKGRADIDMEGG